MSGPETTDRALRASRAETRSAFENRALVYAHVFRELTDEIGAERAAAVLKRAIYARGVEVGLKYRDAAQAGDLVEVGRIFCEGSPADGTLFEPAVERVEEDSIVLSMHGCPLVDAWKAAGLPPEEIDRLCEIAAAVDEGTFEGAGLSITFLERTGAPGSSRCLLELGVVHR
jgi:hypothetical protein